MKILQVDTFSAWNAQANCQGLFKAYSKVGQARQFDYRQSARKNGVNRMNWHLLQVAVDFKPDIIHLDKCESVYGSTIEAIRNVLPSAYIYHLYGDLRPTVQKYVADIGPHVNCTMFYYDDERMFAKHLKRGCNDCKFWFNGTDPDIFYPRDVPKQYDVVFFGNWQKAGSSDTSGRMDCIRAIADAGFSVVVHGKKWSKLKGYKNVTLRDFVDMDDFAIACSKAHVSLGWNTINTHCYTSWRRLLNSMACGTMVMTRFFPGLETIFKRNEHLAWFGCIDNCVEMLTHYWKEDKVRERIARGGMEEVKRAHTWDHRVGQVLKWAKL
jgi:glycosyltransferase involved in cell wall biosynthesis